MTKKRSGTYAYLPSSILSRFEPCNLRNFFAFLHNLLDLFVPIKFWWICASPLCLLCSIWNLLQDIAILEVHFGQLRWTSLLQIYIQLDVDLVGRQVITWLRWRRIQQVHSHYLKKCRILDASNVIDFQWQMQEVDDRESSLLWHPWFWLTLDIKNVWKERFFDLHNACSRGPDNSMHIRSNMQKRIPETILEAACVSCPWWFLRQSPACHLRPRRV